MSLKGVGRGYHIALSCRPMPILTYREDVTDRSDNGQVAKTLPIQIIFAIFRGPTIGCSLETADEDAYLTKKVSNIT